MLETPSPLETSARGTINNNGSAHLNASVGAVFLGRVALVLLFALLRSQKRHCQLLETMLQEARP
ncbi:MAG: hypothetical protein HC915_15080 [Anaerolineae bacterium]|nr:hypothetical protein [Anaerolineae bacterium]